MLRLSLFTSVSLDTGWTDVQTEEYGKLFMHQRLKQPRVSCFHHRRSELDLIDIHDHCRVVGAGNEYWLYLFPLKTKARCWWVLVGFFFFFSWPGVKGYGGNATAATTCERSGVRQTLINYWYQKLKPCAHVPCRAFSFLTPSPIHLTNQQMYNM